jgi:putative transposase
LADLGITKTHAPLPVSDDNPFSDSLIKTKTYRQGFPERFGSIQDARGLCQAIFLWYDTEHHHGGIGLLTPQVFHPGRGADPEPSAGLQPALRTPFRTLRKVPSEAVRPTP